MTDYFHMSMEERDIRTISNLGLAHMGDAVYELLVRAWLCEQGRATARGLHRAAVDRVAAPAQAAVARKLLPHLTETEQGIYRRGRNARVSAVPQNASPEEYHAATGLEALFGHLYLKGETDRIGQLFALAMDISHGGQHAPEENEHHAP
ncbi:MAG: ribonuclease III [Oscillospiraceae bacterium]|nr:ribonuclease III [Oscillospiraceae bacterium]